MFRTFRTSFAQYVLGFGAVADFCIEVVLLTHGHARRQPRSEVRLALVPVLDVHGSSICSEHRLTGNIFIVKKDHS